MIKLTRVLIPQQIQDIIILMEQQNNKVEGLIVPTLQQKLVHSQYESRIKQKKSKPGQFVISYNFENAETKNRTQNVIIGNSISPINRSNKLQKLTRKEGKSKVVANLFADLSMSRNSKNRMSPYSSTHYDMFWQGPQFNAHATKAKNEKLNQAKLQLQRHHAQLQQLQNLGCILNDQHDSATEYQDFFPNQLPSNGNRLSKKLSKGEKQLLQIGNKLPSSKNSNLSKKKVRNPLGIKVNSIADNDQGETRSQLASKAVHNRANQRLVKRGENTNILADNRKGSQNGNQVKTMRKNYNNQVKKDSQKNRFPLANLPNRNEQSTSVQQLLHPNRQGKMTSHNNLSYRNQPKNYSQTNARGSYEQKIPIGHRENLNRCNRNQLREKSKLVGKNAKFNQLSDKYSEQLEKALRDGQQNNRISQEQQNNHERMTDDYSQLPLNPLRGTSKNGKNSRNRLHRKQKSNIQNINNLPQMNEEQQDSLLANGVSFSKPKKQDRKNRLYNTPHRGKQTLTAQARKSNIQKKKPSHEKIVSQGNEANFPIKSPQKLLDESFSETETYEPKSQKGHKAQQHIRQRQASQRNTLKKSDKETKMQGSLVEGATIENVPKQQQETEQQLGHLDDKPEEYKENNNGSPTQRKYNQDVVRNRKASEEQYPDNQQINFHEQQEGSNSDSVQNRVEHQNGRDLQQKQLQRKDVQRNSNKVMRQQKERKKELSNGSEERKENGIYNRFDNGIQSGSNNLLRGSRINVESRGNRSGMQSRQSKNEVYSRSVSKSLSRSRTSQQRNRRTADKKKQEGWNHRFHVNGTAHLNSDQIKQAKERSAERRQNSPIGQSNRSSISNSKPDTPQKLLFNPKKKPKKYMRSSQGTDTDSSLQHQGRKNHLPNKSRNKQNPLTSPQGSNKGRVSKAASKNQQKPRIAKNSQQLSNASKQRLSRKQQIGKGKRTSKNTHDKEKKEATESLNNPTNSYVQDQPLQQIDEDDLQNSDKHIKQTEIKEQPTFQRNQPAIKVQSLEQQQQLQNHFVKRQDQERPNKAQTNPKKSSSKAINTDAQHQNTQSLAKPYDTIQNSWGADMSTNRQRVLCETSNAFQSSMTKPTCEIQKNPQQYERAPIVSYLYNTSEIYDSQIAKYDPGVLKEFRHFELQKQYDPQDSLVSQAVSILGSIDVWLIQRLIEPINQQKEQIGIWLYCQGIWRCIIIPYQKEDNFLILIQNALKAAIKQYFASSNSCSSIQNTLRLQDILKMLSGARVQQMKINSKTYKEVKYNVKKNHIVKALVTDKRNDGINRLCDITKVETLADGSNVIQIKVKHASNNNLLDLSNLNSSIKESNLVWIKQEKFLQVFKYFLLICCRAVDYWTCFSVKRLPEHRSVYHLHATVPTSGSITLRYSSRKKSSLYFYKEVEPKVLKFVGKVQQKNNGQNVYFEFTIKGSYYLFVDSQEQNCLLTYQGSSQVQFQFIEHVKSESLKNQQCQYVEMMKIKKGEGLKFHQMKQKFIDFLMGK